MTELERARAHLWNCQWSLRAFRRDAKELGGSYEETVRHAEGHVLAALSWVWEAQQQYLFQEEHRFIDEMRQLGADGPELNAAIQARRDALLTMGKHAPA